MAREVRCNRRPVNRNAGQAELVQGGVRPVTAFRSTTFLLPEITGIDDAFNRWEYRVKSFNLTTWMVLVTCFGLGCAAVHGDGDNQLQGTGGAPTAAATGGKGGGHAAGSTGGTSPVPDGGVLVVNDASSTCTRLNIGIIGNPGSNPSSNFQSWLEARGTTVQRIQTTADVPLTTDALEPFDVVVIDFPARTFTADEAAIFAAWVNAGGGFAAMSGYHDDPSQDWRANPLLAPLGLAFAGDRIWGPVTMFADHPITAGLSSVTFTGGYPVAEVGSSSSTRTPIGFISANGNKTPVAYAVTMGDGKGFVWGDEWIEFDSEWSSQPQIPRLWLQVFSWLAPGDRCMLTGIG